MGLEPAHSFMDDEFISDSDAFDSVLDVLDGVRMAPSLVSPNDRNQYDYLLSIVDPTKIMQPDDEALLATALKAISGAVFKLDISFHHSLLSNIFGLRLWNFGVDARNAWLELITNLAAVPDKYLDCCLHVLVSNVLPPFNLRKHMDRPKWLMRKKEIHNELRMAFHLISYTVPLAPAKLKNLILTKFPRHREDKYVIVLFTECILGLENEEIGKFLGSTLLTKVVELLIELDVHITWEDIVQEERNKGIFVMELEDWEDSTDTVAKNGMKDNFLAEKLDALMVLVCEHIKSRADGGHLSEVFDTLLEIFKRSVLKLHKSKFTQFLMFYACSLDPETCGAKFAIQLTDIFVSDLEDPDSRMKAVAYIASYLARAKFISSSLVASILNRLVEWCHGYCNFCDNQEKKINPRIHRVFYSGCQAVMYILCFRMRQILDVPPLKQLLFHMPLSAVLSHPSLTPLKVCLPSIVQEFLRQAKAAQLFDGLPSFLRNYSFDSRLSKAFGGAERLDMFFPFDPYLLKESDRFMRPNFEFWSMVKTTYSNVNSDDDDDEGLDDLDDAPRVPESTGLLEGNDDLDLDEDGNVDDDDLDYSLDKMSITPKAAAPFMATDLDCPSRMPARIRPSQSPKW